MTKIFNSKSMNLNRIFKIIYKIWKICSFFFNLSLGNHQILKLYAEYFNKINEKIWSIDHDKSF